MSSINFGMQLLPILIGIILILYIIYNIRKEDKSYPKESIEYILQGIQILTPKWWGVFSQDENRISFKRTDTRYDWQATFIYINKDVTDIEQEYRNIIKEKDILFDPDHSYIHSPRICEKLFSTYPDLKAVRIESTATENGIDRIYYDLAIIKHPIKNGYFLCESKSSVLNGMVEGPFFEKVIKHLEIAKTVV